MVGFAGAHRDPSIFLELSEEVLDEVTPFVGFLVEVCRKAPVRSRWDDRLDVTLRQIGPQPVGIEGTVGQKMSGTETGDQVRHAAQIVRLPRQQAEIDGVSERIGQRHDLGGDATARAPDGLALSPPLAPCPERWTLTMEPSIIAYSKSASEANALNIR